MNQKKAEYIALYSLVFGVILVFGILIRQFVLSKGIDDFSSTVAFFATESKWWLPTISIYHQRLLRRSF